MKIFVMTDMEGVSGICRSSQVGGEEYPAGKRYFTWDVNACVDGCFQGGAEKVTVRDGHGGGANVIWDELDPRADYIQGAYFRERIPGIDSYDGLILLGYHAMAGTAAAVLEHTMSSRAWQNLWINGLKVGEVAVDAGVAGDHGVPVIMVSGDDKVCRESQELLPGVITAEVKKGLAVEAAVFLSKQKAHDLIRDCAVQAVKNCRKMKPYKFSSPVTMRLELVERGHIPLKSHVKIIDGRTYEVTGPNVEETFRLL